MKITVLGNPDLPEDNAAIKLIPWLKQKYPGAEIKVEDPSGGLEPPNQGGSGQAADDWLIVDACEGIDKITEFVDLDKFEALRRVGVHDYEVMTELKLLKKLGKIKKLKILAIPLVPRKY